MVVLNVRMLLSGERMLEVSPLLLIPAFQIQTCVRPNQCYLFRDKTDRHRQAFLSAPVRVMGTY